MPPRLGAGLAEATARDPPRPLRLHLVQTSAGERGRPRLTLPSLGCSFFFVELPESASGLTPELVEFVHSGVAVGVATRDEGMRPALARAWGPQVAEDRRSLTVCVSAATGSAMRANLEGNGAVAIGFCPPTMAKAVQLKGVATAVGEPAAEALERVEQHVRAFAAECARIGVPPEFPGRIFERATLVLITVSIDDGFDQTPGPTAGRRL